MFPDAKFLDMDLYTWALLVGVLCAMVLFRFVSGKAGLDGKVFNFSLIVGVAAVVLGYLSAVLFQSYYHFMDTNVWEWGVGSTFYGGLIGAIVTFLLCYFTVGHFVFKDKAHLREFNKMLCCIIPCIVAAHGIGRIGCLFAGCCYGAETDSWIGITMWVHGTWTKVVPLQLFEAIYLFGLAAFLIYMALKRDNKYIASMYLIAYGVWRFIIEYWRDDHERGSSGISFLTPSQLTAIIMVVIGVAYIFAYKYFLKDKLETVGKIADEQAE